MNILITGGAGFIGSRLSEFYLRQNHQVTIFDSLARSEGIVEVKKLKTTFGNQCIFTTQDVRNYDALAEVVVDQDVVFHLAGHTNRDTALSHPRYDFEVNGFGTLNLLEAIRVKNPRALVVYASSSLVYGDLVNYHKSRFSESQPLNLTDPVGCSIGAADQYVHDFYRSYGVKTVVLRLSEIYGVGQLGIKDDDWIRSAIFAAINHQPINIYGDGTAIFDPLYSEDLVDAFNQTWINSDQAIGQIFNIGGGIENKISRLDVVKLINKTLSITSQIKNVSPRKSDQHYFVSNCDKAKAKINWHSKTAVSVGLVATINHYLSESQYKAV